MRVLLRVGKRIPWGHVAVACFILTGVLMLGVLIAAGRFPSFGPNPAVIYMEAFAQLDAPAMRAVSQPDSKAAQVADRIVALTAQAAEFGVPLPPAPVFVQHSEARATLQNDTWLTVFLSDTGAFYYVWTRDGKVFQVD